MLNTKCILSTIVSLLFVFAHNLVVGQSATQAENNKNIFIDAVIASVDGEPITLQEVLDRLPGKPQMDLKEASDDIQARSALNSIIMEQLITQEAKSRRVQASNPEIEGYIDEVASRNQLTREAFEIALAEQGTNLDAYKKQVEIDILRTKIATSMLKGGIAVTDEEIDAYVNEHPEYSGSGSKVRLRQIFLSLDSRTEEEGRKIAEVLRDKIQSGQDFSEIASTHSEASEAKEGGLLGVMAEEDLSSIIFDAIFGLEEGGVSQVVKSPAGIHLFMVEERFVKKDNAESIRQEVRKAIENEKLQSKMQTYFSHEIFKQHAVDNKL